MQKTIIFIILMVSFALIPSTAFSSKSGDNPILLSTEKEFIDQFGMEPDDFLQLKEKPLYEFTPAEVDLYIRFLQQTIPHVRDRITHLSRKMLGQPYSIYLLGEAPFEIYDDAPLYNLEYSDCVTFVETMYAMALSHNWPTFMALLQRIRYKDGEISYVTRNHWSLAEWNINNSWLVKDITHPDFMDEEKLGLVRMRLDKARWFRARTPNYLSVGQHFEPFSFQTYYVPHENIPDVAENLQPGDLVQIIRGFQGPEWCGHFGLIMQGKNGTLNFLDSAGRGVTETDLIQYIDNLVNNNENIRRHNEKHEKYRDEIRELEKQLEEKWFAFFTRRRYNRIKQYKSRRPFFWGMKFMRFREDSLDRLKKIDGKDAPLVTAPRGLLYRDDVKQ